MTGLEWKIQAYISSSGVYLVCRRGDQDWIVIARWSHMIYDGFSNENDAMTFAQELNQANTIGSPQAESIMEIAPLRVTPPAEVTIEGALANAGHPAP